MVDGDVIFPNVGKGGIGVGGAVGNGVVYEQNQMIGMAKLSQVSIGFQAGGLMYKASVGGQKFKYKKKCNSTNNIRVMGLLL